MLLLLCSLALAGDLLIDDTWLWDGTGAPRSGPLDVLVRDGKIAEISSQIQAPADARILDGQGATLIPGLIDSHVHLSMDPGAAWRSDTPAERDLLLTTHLAAYLAVGVTTILDPAVSADELARIRSALKDGAPGPRYLTLGPPFSPAGGYPAVVVPGFPTVVTPDDVARQLDLLQAEGVVGIKVTVEEGPAGRIWPLYTPEVTEAIRSGAEARHLPIYAHAFSPGDQIKALDELGATAMVHAPDRVDHALIERVVAEHIPEISTISPFDAFRYSFTPALLDDPLIQLTVPEAERAVVRDRDLKRDFFKTFLHTVSPRLPLPGLFSRALRQPLAVQRRHIQRSIRALHDAGATIIMGSDAGNWPIFPFLFHGPTSIRELELLVEAGLSPTEALRAATSAPAHMLGMDGEIGVIQVGAAADLVLVEGDPLQDVAALQHVRFTVRAGEARTPEGWMAEIVGR